MLRSPFLDMQVGLFCCYSSAGAEVTIIGFHSSLEGITQIEFFANVGAIHLGHGSPVDVIVAGTVYEVGSVNVIIGSKAPVSGKAFGILGNIAESGLDFRCAACNRPDADVVQTRM